MNAFRKSELVRGFAWLGILLGTAWWPARGWANPTGGQVILGNANISTLDPSSLLIQQLSDRALIQWDSFSIAQGELTRFAQPGSNSVALNRVIGGSPSQLNGLLQGNGNVWLINPGGVFVGANGVVDVGGFMASTLDMSNDDFARGGAFRLSGDSSASVRNLGTIRAATGDVYLVARQVENSGAIGALHGTVAMAGGNEVLINPGGAHGEKVFVSGGPGSVTNDGQITSAYSELKAHGNVHAIAVQNSGSIRATGAERVGGRVVLRSGQGDISSSGVIEAVGSGSIPGSIAMDAGSGEVRIGGLLRASSEGGAGGDIDLVGRSVLVESGAEVDASGITQGGAVDVVAGEIVIYGNSTLSANGAVGGDVRLQATGGVLVAGRVAAEGAEGAGGRLVATGDRVVLQEGAEMNASGFTGGEIRVGGGVSGQDAAIANAREVAVDPGVRLAADGRSGDGGSVVVFADGAARFDGLIEARATGVVGNGGFAEVSGRQDLRIGGMVDTSSVAGQTGIFLIDPVDVSVAASGGTIQGSVLSGLLGSNNVILHTSGTGGTGNITVEDPVEWASDNSLAMLAHNDINIYNHIRNAGGTWTVGGPLTQKDGRGNIYLVAGWNGSAGWNGVTPSPVNAAAVNMTQAAYFDTFFSEAQEGTTYAVGGAGNITIAAGFNATNNGVVVGSRYGTTGLAGNAVNLYGNTSTYGFAMVGFRDNGRIGTWSGSTLTPNDNYWWYTINPNSALPGQGLALDGIGTGNLKNFDSSDYDLNTESDRSVNTGIFTGTQAVAHVAAGGLVGEAASLLQPEWHELQAYDSTRATDVNYAANASAIRGDLVVRAGQNVNLVAGINEGFAQIGHVGATGSANLRTVSGSATANGPLLFQADRDDNGLPGTGATPGGTGNRSGAPEVDGAHVFGADIDVRAGLGGAGYLLMYSNRGTSQMGYTQIGHGGPRTSGVHSGNISVDTEGGVFQFGGAGAMSYSAIGHATAEGFHMGRSHQYSGDISVTTRGTVLLQAHQFGLADLANPNRNFVQIGHGGPSAQSNESGRNADGSFSTDNNQIRLGRHINLMLNSNLLQGAITVAGDRGVSLEAGNRVFSSAQIGHNATQWGGEATRTINDVVYGAGGSNAGTPTGASGTGSNGQWHYDPVTGAISGSDPNNFGTNPYHTGSVKISHESVSGGTSGILVASSAGPVTVTAGVPGRINVGARTGYDAAEYRANQASDNVRLAYAMIGSGGYDGKIGFEAVTNDATTRGTPWTTPSGDVTVHAYQDVQVLGGSHQIDFAKIGNGGDNTRSPYNALDEGTLVGNVEVLSETGNILIQGGDAVGFAPLGTLPGVVARDRMWAMVGNGGYNADFGRIEGDILVRSYQKGVTVQAGRGDWSFAMIGNGGPDANDGASTNQAGANRGFDGKISVIAAQDVLVLGGGETALDAGIDPGPLSPDYRSTWRYGRDNTNGTEVFLNYAQIGHGGPNSQAELGATLPSDIEVFGRDVTIRGGEGMLAYAQVGHGGSVNVNLAFDMNLDRTGNGVIPTGNNFSNYPNYNGTAGDALDVGSLFLIRPNGRITAGPDGILGTLDDRVNDGYAEATYNLDFTGFGDNPDVRFFALQPGTVGNFSFSLSYGAGTPLSTAVADWNAAHPTRQIGFVGRDVNPSAVQNISITLTGGVNNRYGADGIPGGTDDLRISTVVPGAFDDGSQQSRQAPTDGRTGNIYVHAGRDLTVEGGNRGSVSGNLAESFAYSQIGHGGPGSTGPTTGDIEVTVGGNLYLQGNFAGDGIGDFSMDQAKFLNLGTPDQATLSLLFRTRDGSTNGAVVTLSPGLTVQESLDNYNAGVPTNDQVELNPIFANAGDLRFKTAQTVTVAGGRDWATAAVTVNTALGPVVLQAVNRGAVGNSIAFQVKEGDYLQDAIDEWNSNNLFNQVTVASGNPLGVITGTPIVQLTGGIDGIVATGSQAIAWFSAKATDVDPVLTFGAAPTTLWEALNTWNQADGTANGGPGLNYASGNLERDQRIGFFGVDFDTGGSTTVSSGGLAGETSFVVANVSTIKVGAIVGTADASAKIPPGTVVTAIDPATRTVTISNPVTTDLTSGQTVDFRLMGVEDLQLTNTSITLTGGVAGFMDWNARGTQTAPAAYSYLNFSFGSSAPTSLGINAVQGDAYAKIGHGEDVRDLLREPGMYLNNTFAFIPSTGNVSVSVGGSGTFLAGSVGHVNSQQGSTFTRYVSGSTYLAVSRLNPGVTGGGALLSSALGAFNTSFASGRDGIDSELRFYAPNEDLMALAGSSRLNGEFFVADAVFGRPDSSVESENVMDTTSGMFSRNFASEFVPGAPIHTFGAVPQGTYQLNHGIGGIGKYTLFFSVAAPPEPVVVPFFYTPDQARDLAAEQPDDQIFRYERVEERSPNNRTFTFANYWANQGEWRTDTYRIGYLGGLGGGNALVLDENGQWVPMPINLDPNAGAREVSLEQATGAESGAPAVPSLPFPPAEEKKKVEEGENPFGTSTEGSGVNTDAGAGAAGMGAADDMGGGAKGGADAAGAAAPAADAPKPEAPEAPKPEAAKPEAPKPEAPKPEAPKPEAPKPAAPKPEAPKPAAPNP